MRCWVVIFSLLCVTAHTVRADYLPEALACDSTRIYRGKLVERKAEQDPAYRDGVRLTLTFAVEETLKGEALPRQVVGPFKVYKFRAEAFEEGQELLICAVEARSSTYYDHEPILVAAKVGKDAGYFEYAAKVLDAQLRPMPPNEVVRALREELGQSHGPGRVIYVNYYASDGGSTLYLLNDARLGVRVRQWVYSADPVQKQVAIGVMKVAQVPDRLEMLRSLIRDGQTADVTMFASPWQPAVYPVRSEAAYALHELHESVPEMADASLFEAPQRLYRRIPFAWPLVILLPLAVGGYFTSRKGRSGFWVSAFRGLAAGNMGILLLMLLGWWRSYSVADDFIIAREPYLASVTSYHGGVQFIWLDSVSKSMPLVHAAMKPSPGGGCVIDQHDRLFWHGFGSAFGDGATWHDPAEEILFSSDAYFRDPVDTDIGMSTRGKRAVIPFRYLGGAAGLLPAVAMMQLGYMGWRRRMRRTGMVCESCGYDVRVQAGTKGARCPECGTVVKGKEAGAESKNQ